MRVLAGVLLVSVAVIHIGIMGAEMFPWNYPLLLGAVGADFGFVKEGEAAVPIVQNAGLFNGFLAAGLIWSFWKREDVFSFRMFLLTCIAIAGVFGALTLKNPLLPPPFPAGTKIPGGATLWLQTLPAVIAAVVCIKERGKV